MKMYIPIEVQLTVSSTLDENVDSSGFIIAEHMDTSANLSIPLVS